MLIDVLNGRLKTRGIVEWSLEIRSGFGEEIIDIRNVKDTLQEAFKMDASGPVMHDFDASL